MYFLPVSDTSSCEKVLGKMQALRWLGANHPKLPLFLTIPHSGEIIPPEATWLKGVSQGIMLTDVDRFVDRLYAPLTRQLSLPALVTCVHRYVADLNRYPDDIDADAVEGVEAPSGEFSKGFHWVMTTRGDRIMNRPISRDLHDRLVRDYHDTFHNEIDRKVTELRKRIDPSHTRVFHLDCHSMPSQGTAAHVDSGENRADVVISDQKGKSASTEFKDLVISSFEAQGLKIAYNWPYIGGRITQRYGRPEAGHETIQIELNRKLYMDEETRDPSAGFDALSGKLTHALAAVVKGLGRFATHS